MGYVLIPKLLNNPFVFCFFINLGFLQPHITHFDDKIVLSLFVFITFEFTFSVFFLHLRQYVKIIYDD